MLRAMLLLTCASLLAACGVEDDVNEWSSEDFWDDAPGMPDPEYDGALVPVWDVEEEQGVQDRDNWPPSWAELENEVLRLVNVQRARGGNCGGEPFRASDPVELDVYLRTAARLHSEDMGAKDYFSHDSKDGRDFVQRIDDAGFTGNGPWGENIACGQTSPKEVVDGWMKSPGHCSNILEPSYAVLGVGYANDPSSGCNHLWTQDFAGTP